MPLLTFQLPLRLPRTFTIRNLLVAFIWIVLAIGAMTFASKPDDVDPKLNGTWKLVSLQYHGETTNFEEKAARLVIDGSKVNYAREKIEIEGLTGYLGLALKFDADRKCVEVQSTLEGAPAKKAGLEKGDVVLAIGNERAVELLPTIEMVRKAKPTTKLDIQIRRGEAVKEIQVLVGALPFSYIAGLES